MHRPHYYRILTLLVLSLMSTTSCWSVPSKNVLKVEDFQQKMDQLNDEILIDVRTPPEFAEDHLKNALNIDWEGKTFETSVAKLDRSKPVFVYCHSGRRSEEAAAKMRRMGFAQVYDMKGGIMQWRAANLPEDGFKAAGNSITTAEYKRMLVTDKLVLVDFSAPWCGPCKRMAPYIDEIEKEKNATVKVIKINADDNQQLAMDLQIAALPTVFLYKNQQIVWRHVGYASKETLLNTINSIK